MSFVYSLKVLWKVYSAFVYYCSDPSKHAQNAWSLDSEHFDRPPVSICENVFLYILALYFLCEVHFCINN